MTLKTKLQFYQTLNYVFKNFAFKSHILESKESGFPRRHLDCAFFHSHRHWFIITFVGG
jgi:hypothetical protein